MKGLFALAIVTLVALSPFKGASAQQIQSMKLLTTQVGWAHSGRHLYWTANGGANWKDIAPSQSPKRIIVDVMFLNTELGWALLSGGDEDAEEPEFDLAFTSNAGKDWLTMPVKVPDLDPKSVTLNGNGTIYFVDADHGWMNLAAVSSAAFRSSSMLMTTDGGKTWAWTPGGSGAGVGSLYFITAKDGWVAGGPDDQHIAVTHDGAKAWTDVVLKAPPDVPSKNVPTYDVPAFSDSKHGSLPVTYSNPDSGEAVVVFFSTDDGGNVWKAGQELKVAGSFSGGQRVPSAVTNTAWLVATVSRNGSIQLMTALRGAKPSTTVGRASSGQSEVYRLSFTNPSHGWASTSLGLLSTDDGGANWKDITPVTKFGTASPR